MNLRFMIFCSMVFSFLCGIKVLAFQNGMREVLIHDKVGYEIDLEERNKYRLFARDPGFVSAVLLRLPDQNFEWRIICTDSSTGESIQKKRPTDIPRIEQLRNYLSNFDELNTPGLNSDSINTNGSKNQEHTGKPETVDFVTMFSSHVKLPYKLSMNFNLGLVNYLPSFPPAGDGDTEIEEDHLAGKYSIGLNINYNPISRFAFGLRLAH